MTDATPQAGPSITVPAGVIDSRAAFSLQWRAATKRTGVPPAAAAAAQPAFWPVATSPDATHPDPVDPADVGPCVLVPGLLGDSVRRLVAPLFCARARLGPQGYDVEVAWVNGRTGSDENARQLRDRVLRAADRAGQAVHLVGYSKGCTDALHLLANHPEAHAGISSLTSLAGVVHGTPLAAGTPDLLHRLLARLPLPGIGRGDGQAIQDLEPGARARHLAEHPLPAGIRYASLIAAPTPAQVSRVLRGSHARLACVDTDNDSQVIALDALLPQGELLAVLNADHWAVALPIAERHPWIGRWLVTRNDFPRAILLEALLQHLASPLPAR